MDIIHRDIKLDNIMVNNRNISHTNDIENFEFKIGDMGLAKPLSFNQELTQTFAGTPLMMAPEQICGDKYGTKADVWSLGTLLFQMLTGLYPFFGQTYDELRRNISDGSYQIPNDVEISVDCMEFLNCCLRFDC